MLCASTNIERSAWQYKRQLRLNVLRPALWMAGVPLMLYLVSSDGTAPDCVLRCSHGSKLRLSKPRVALLHMGSPCECSDDQKLNIRKKAPQNYTCGALLLYLVSSDDLLSHGEAPHYHRRDCVSLLSSAWDQVGPQCYCHQTKIWLLLAERTGLEPANRPVF